LCEVRERLRSGIAQTLGHGCHGDESAVERDVNGLAFALSPCGRGWRRFDAG
jgi:hypothetical protein